MEKGDYMLGALLRVAFRAIVDDIETALGLAGHSDLRPPHLVVFQQIRPGGTRASLLAEGARITKQSMSYLEERGYLAKFDDPSDRRAQLIRLTEKGRNVERIARQSILGTQSKWAAIVGENRVRELIATLQVLVAHEEADLENTGRQI
jgi:DNA-binding MarR family transcriptional regulator